MQEFHVSKSNEKLILGFEANATNVFNQHSVTFVNQNLIGTGSIQPYACGDAGVNPATCSPDAGFDYAAVINGYNDITTANSKSTPGTI